MTETKQQKQNGKVRQIKEEAIEEAPSAESTVPLERHQLLEEMYLNACVQIQQLQVANQALYVKAPEAVETLKAQYREQMHQALGGDES